MASNAEIEMRWVSAWSDLCEIVGDRPDVRCQLPDGSVVGVEDCKGWLQDSAYAGFRVGVAAGRVEGRPGIIASRSMPEVDQA